MRSLILEEKTRVWSFLSKRNKRAGASRLGNKRQGGVIFSAADNFERPLGALELVYQPGGPPTEQL
jgi:hypothetical protein